MKVSFPRTGDSSTGGIRVAPIFSLLLLFSSAIAQAQTDGTSPAIFREGRGLERYIKIPDSPENFSMVVPCRTMVSTDGELENSSCIFSGETAIPYIKAIQVAAIKAKMVPARVDGLRRRVGINYSVAFAKESGATTVKVFLNHGRDAATYGPAYLEPQVFEWPSSGVEGRCVRPPNMVWVLVLVGTDGLPIMSRVDVAQAPEDCEDWALEYVNRWKFIPGTANGKPVDAFTGRLFSDVAGHKVGIERPDRYRGRP